MTNAKHTPGPWYVAGGGKIRSEPVKAAGFADCVCTMPYSSAGEAAEMPEAVANARLIAAAPDLLAALVATLDLWRQHGLGDEDAESEPVYAAALAAVRKATN